MRLSKYVRFKAEIQWKILKQLQRNEFYSYTYFLTQNKNDLSSSAYTMHNISTLIFLTYFRTVLGDEIYFVRTTYPHANINDIYTPLLSSSFFSKSINVNVFSQFFLTLCVISKVNFICTLYVFFKRSDYTHHNYNDWVTK